MLQYYIGPSLEQPGNFFLATFTVFVIPLEPSEQSESLHKPAMVPSLCRPRQGSNIRKIIEGKEKRTRKIHARRKFSPPSPLPRPPPPPDTWTNFLNGPFFSKSSKNCRAMPWGCCFEQPQSKSDLHCDCKDWIPEILLESHLVSSIFTFCSSAAILCMLIGPRLHVYTKK